MNLSMLNTMNAKDRLQRYLQQITSLSALAGETLTTSDYRLAFSALRSIPVDNELLQVSDELENASLKAIQHFMATGELPDRGLEKLAAVAELESMRITLNDIVMEWQRRAQTLPIDSRTRRILFECAGQVLQTISSK